MAAATAASGRAAANSGSLAANSAARRSWSSRISLDISEPHNFANWEICSCDAARNEYYVSKGNDIPVEHGLQREIRHCDRRRDIVPSVTSVTAELPVPMCPSLSDKWGATAGAVRPACDGPVMDDTTQRRG